MRAEAPLVQAANRELDAGSLREQLGRLGNTAYALDELELDLRGRPFVPASLLNQLRREAVDLLSEEQARVKSPPPYVSRSQCWAMRSLLPST